MVTAAFCLHYLQFFFCAAGKRGRGKWEGVNALQSTRVERGLPVKPIYHITQYTMRVWLKVKVKIGGAFNFMSFFFVFLFFFVWQHCKCTVKILIKLCTWLLNIWFGFFKALVEWGRKSLIKSRLDKVSAKMRKMMLVKWNRLGRQKVEGGQREKKLR